jgi:hypothetical protein
MEDTESIVQKLYAALARGDVAGAVALMSPQIEWLEAERTPYFTGLVIGPDKVIETVLEPVNKDFENFAITEQNYITQDYSGLTYSRDRHLQGTPAPDRARAQGALCPRLGGGRRQDRSLHTIYRQRRVGGGEPTCLNGVFVRA